MQLVTAQPEVSPQPLAAAPPAPEAVVPPVGAPAATSPAFTLPPPAPAAPEIVDTRPPRPAGVGPSITPAPVIFSPESGLPTVRQLPPTSGPASASQLVDPAFNATCSTIGAVLARIPEASNWTQLVNVSLGWGMLRAGGHTAQPICWPRTSHLLALHSPSAAGPGCSHSRLLRTAERAGLPVSRAVMRAARLAGCGQSHHPIPPCPSLPPAQSAGLNILLQGKTAQVTLLVPINSGGCWILQRCVWSWAWDACARRVEYCQRCHSISPSLSPAPHRKKERKKGYAMGVG